MLVSLNKKLLILLTILFLIVAYLFFVYFNNSTFTLNVFKKVTIKVIYKESGEPVSGALVYIKHYFPVGELLMDGIEKRKNLFETKTSKNGEAYFNIIKINYYLGKNQEYNKNLKNSFENSKYAKELANSVNTAVPSLNAIIKKEGYLERHIEIKPNNNYYEVELNLLTLEREKIENSKVDYSEKRNCPPNTTLYGDKYSSQYSCIPNK